MPPALLYITCAESGLHGLRHLLRRGRKIAAVVTISPALAAEHEVSGYVDIGPLAEELGLRCTTLKSYAMSREDVAATPFDILIVNGWNRIIPAEIIDLARLGAIGLHAGHPPIGLGRAPLVWNILLGRTDIEVYAFRLTPRADDGDILARRPVEITPQDDVGLLYEKVFFAGARLIDEAVNRVAQGERGQPQDMSDAVHYGKRTAADGLIDFSQSEVQIHNFVRAQSSPYPGAFSTLEGVRWVIDRAVPFDRFAFRDLPREPGKIVAALPKGIVVLTGGSPIWILAARASDGRAIPAPLRQTESLVGRRFDRWFRRPQE
jgi:methionyl-tRNA formyltransferase